ncbi:transcriptional regulator [Desulfuribacillus stibiiarsenatis]|uniref:Transcriptional regulator n=1 Tax=Desulfuribacillus stibiiarsenatis TaxID=1390249 RepID=A0A1E5L8T2_9FIRM|nr:transcriptional regulator [Desulfuribacillus stibiiarsenatis]
MHRQNKTLKKEIKKCFSQVVESGNFVLGDNVRILEEQISYFCNVKQGIGVANGSDALYLSLLACGVGNGDEVITTPFTFFATAGAITRTGAKPVFVDIDAKTWNIDANLIEEKITTRTKAILPVHLYGCPVEMDAIMEIAKRYQLKVIEDAAQALGAEFKGQKVGSFGDTCCISFFPTKNLGAFGDAGMVLTNNPDIAERIKLLRVHGAKKKYCHEILGCNSRLDELQAAILRTKYKYFEQWTNRRRQIAKKYHDLFQKQSIIVDGVNIKLPHEPTYAYHVYHQYTIQTKQRDQLKEHLKQNGVETTVYYPIPMHLQEVFAPLGYGDGDFPIAEAACNEVLSLPMFPELTDKEVGYVVQSIIDFFSK